jgi:O-antigen ligase
LSRRRRVETRDALEAEDYLLLGAVLSLPWAFGGVQVWAYRSAGFLLSAAAAVSLVKHGWKGLGLDRSGRWLLPAGLLAGWALVQVLPLPPAAIRLLSPRADAVYRETFPGYPGSAPADVVAALERDALERVPEARDVPLPKGNGAGPEPELRGRWSGWRTLSLQPGATVERLLWFLALLLAFLLARRRLADKIVMRRYRALCFALFAALALFGLAQKATWNGRMYWVGPKVEDAFPFGPYVNFDHFAAVMELAVPWLAAFAWSRTRGRWRETLTDPKALGSWGAAALCLVAGFTAGSKMAAVLLVASLSVLTVLAIGRRVRPVVSALALLLLWSVGGLLAFSTPLGGRVASFLALYRGGESTMERIVAWRAALPVIRDFPLTGTGFGSFQGVYPRYLPAGESEVWAHLHNDYLQVVVEGGLVAGALILWLGWGFVSRAIRRLLATRNPGTRLTRAGVVLGIGSLCLHAVVDFNHQIPANALLFVVVSALAAATPEETPERET